MYREVKGGEGFGSTDPYRRHFGLARNTMVDSLEIWWPSGVTQRFTGLDVNHILSVTESAPDYKALK